MAKEIKAKATLSNPVISAKATLGQTVRGASVPGDYVGPDVPRRGPSDMYSAGAFVYAPAGYYPDLAAQSVDMEMSVPEPKITVSDSGLITAKETISYGAFYRAGLESEKTKQLTQQRSKTVTPSDVEQTAVAAGKFTTGDVKVGPIPYTKHEIYFGFADETDVTIPLYCSDAILSEIITEYAPTTYGGKEIVLAQLDGVTWYEKPTGTWETVYEGEQSIVGEDDGYWWIGSLADVYPALGETWRITVNGNAYVTTAKQQDANTIVIGNPLYNDGTDDGSDCPVAFFNAGWGAWSGGADPAIGRGPHALKIERQVT